MIYRVYYSILLLCIPQANIYAESFSTLNLVWGVSERQGRRPSMEDTYLIQLKEKKFVQSKTPNSLKVAQYPYQYSLFGIFDGHGGSGAAHLAAHYFAHYFSQPHAMSTWLSDSRFAEIFKKTNVQIMHSTRSGTTACIGYIQYFQKNTPRLSLAWVGDTRAVLGSYDNTVMYQTRDHKPNDPREESLIKARTDRNGRQCLISLGNPCRVNGILALSRALGNRDIAECISAEPEVFSIELTPKQHKLLIIACDGVWDVMSCQDALTIVAKAIEHYQTTPHPDIERIIPQEKIMQEGNSIAVYASRCLIDAAYNKGSTDNLSALIILFDWDNTYEQYTKLLVSKNFIGRISETLNNALQKLRSFINF